jgi:hypothetical protein
VPAVTIDTSDPVIIRGAGIRSKGYLITAPPGSFPDLIVEDTTGVATNPGVAGRSPGRFVDANEGTVIVRYNRLIGTSGMYLLGCTSVDVHNNDAINIDGRWSTGAGYSTTDRDLVQFVQCNQTSGPCEIHWNRITNVYGQSAPEDVISLTGAIGTEADPIDIHHNLIHGAFPLTLAGSFGGMAIDADQNTVWSYIHDNVAVATTNVGMAIAGEANNLITNNRCVSSGRDPNGDLFSAASNGIYVWNAYANPAWANNSAPDNAIAWINASGVREDTYFPDCTDCTGNTSAVGGPSTIVTAADEAAEVAAWEAARITAGQIIGPR